MPGAEIEIEAFYGDGDAQMLFKGIVTATRLRVSGREGPQLELTCRDKTIALAGVRKTATFTSNWTAM